jgi:hypothetical protein
MVTIIGYICRSAGEERAVRLACPAVIEMFHDWHRDNGISVTRDGVMEWRPA